MKKAMIWIGSVVLGCSLLFGACRKEDAPTRSQLIVGNWAVNAYGEDDNMNGILDENEQDNIPSGAGLVLTIRTDNTGVGTLNQSGKDPVTKGFTWQLINNDQDVRVTIDGKVSIAHIAKISANQLQGFDQEASPRMIVDLRK